MSGGLDPREAVRRLYRNFVEYEVHGRSALYQQMCEAVCGDQRLLDLIAGFPRPKQQPNLVFGATRHLFGNPRDGHDFAEILLKHADPIRRLILARSTQTNEPGRCAVLMPLLARLPQPLALLEVGASAGLCLLPDCYSYDYGSATIAPKIEREVAPPVFPCVANGATPLPKSAPQIAWRRGLDLSPIDPGDREQTAWLETLVWPEHSARLARLRAALEVARAMKPPIVKGDLRTDLPALAACAPTAATLVIFHSAVLGYLGSRGEIEQFAADVSRLGAVWISNEPAAVLRSVAARAKQPPPRNRFVLALNGEPVAFTGSHGESIDWI